MGTEALAFAEQLYRSNSAHDKDAAEYEQRYRSMSPDSARSIAALVRLGRARRVLEIGTSNGYATIWLADALSDTGGILDTIDSNSKRSDEAHRNLAACGLDHVVNFHSLRAEQYLAEHLHNTTYDLVVLDAERTEYPGYWPFLQEVLIRPGSAVVADDVTSHPDELEFFINTVEAEAGFFTTVLTTGKGLFLAVRR